MKKNVKHNKLINIIKLDDDIVSIPFEYNQCNSNAKNILLIDSLVYQNDILFDSVNSNTLSIKYSYDSSKDELEKFFNDNFESIERIGIIFNDSLINSKQFLNGELFFTSSDLESINEYSSNLKFIIELVKKFKVSNLDFLVCNGLEYPDWVKYFNIITKETGVIVGASDNLTGNLKYGGDWVLESTNEDIKNIYWDESVSNYTTTLATSTISSSITVTNAELNDNTKYTWPIEINGGTQANPVVVTFGDDITLNSISQYFYFGSNYVTIQGNNKSITISGVSDYPGLLKNGLENFGGFSDILIENINFKTIKSSQLYRAGWLCQAYFGTNSFDITVKNCHTDSSIGPNNQCGFICGRGFGQGNGTFPSSYCEIINCSVSGVVETTNGGGVVGIRTGQNGGIVNIKNCFVTGDIGSVNSSEIGGICGQQAGQNGGKVSIIDCYSTSNNLGDSTSSICGNIAGVTNGSVSIINCHSSGIINGNNSSGIIGNQAGQENGFVTITNCYSTGNINGISSSGICGGLAGFTNGTVTVTNCYSTGNINGDYSGGIAGYDFGSNSNNLNQIINSYSTGNINGLNAGGICGTNVGFNNDLESYTPNILIKNCYTLGKILNGGGSICGGESFLNLYYSDIYTLNMYDDGGNGWEGAIFTLYDSKGIEVWNTTLNSDYEGTSQKTISAGYYKIAVSSGLNPLDVFWELYNSSNDFISSGGAPISINYVNVPTVNISNCYSLYGPIVSPSLQITPTQTKTYISPKNTWTDLEAKTYLLETPKYNSSGSLVNPVGTVWADIAPDSTSVPWIFSTFGYSPYTTELVTTFSQTIEQGGKTIEALETTGHTYSIIAINNKLPSLFPGITINSSTGQISVSSSTPSNKYLIKVLKNSDYILTNFELTLKLKSNNFCLKIRLCRNEKYVIMLNKTNSKYALMEKYIIIKKPTHGKVCINSKSKLEYTPDKNYVGSDKFIIEYKNIISELSIQVTFKIKIT